MKKKASKKTTKRKISNPNQYGWRPVSQDIDVKKLDNVVNKINDQIKRDGSKGEIRVFYIDHLAVIVYVDSPLESTYSGGRCFTISLHNLQIMSEREIIKQIEDNFFG